MNSEIIIKNLSSKEQIELSNMFPELNLVELKVKGHSGGIYFLSSDIIQIIYNHLELIDELKGYILDSVFSYSIDQLKGLIKYFKNRNRKIGSISIQYQMKKENITFVLEIKAKESTIDRILELVKDKIDLITPNCQNNDIVYVLYDEIHDTIDFRYNFFHNE